MSKSPPQGGGGRALDRQRLTVDLVIRLPDGTTREAAIDADPDTRVERLTEHLAAWAGVSGEVALYVPRTATPAPSDASVGSLGLARGETLELVTGNGQGLRESTPVPTNLELVAVGGPSIGERWPLADGEQLAGRGTDCKIRVEDTAMSRTHLLLNLEGGLVYVSDAGSTNGTFLDGVRLSGRRVLQPGEVLEAGASLFSIQRASRVGGARREPDLDGRIRFNRPPRIASPAPTDSFSVAASPTPAEPLRLPLAGALVPLVLALILWRMLPDNPSFLIILALSPLMAVISFVGDRRHGKRRSGRAEAEWRGKLESLSKELGEARSTAAQRLREAAPDLSELERRAFGPSSELWERRPSDDDFLLLRCGWGDRAWDPKLHRERGGADELEREADDLLEPLLTLPSVPLTVSLARVGVLGLCGERESALALLRWCVVQLATLHSPEEVTLVLAAGAVLREEQSWLGWLPHAHLESEELPPREAIARVAGAIDQRRSQATTGVHGAVVVMVDEEAEVPRAQVTRLLREGPEVGIHVLWVGSARNDLPGECGAIVEIGANDVSITVTKEGSTSMGAAESVTLEVAERVAHALAPLRDAAPRSSKGEIPRRTTLFELLAVESSGDFVQRSWSAAGAGLRAPLGRAHDGTFVLDLLADGPHALVGGTTGAGKSELLQSLIASLALSYPPSRLTFLLIDYKGGAAFKDCTGLPHTVGVVTDLDARLSERALVSLNAEIRRREQLLRSANARDIAEMESGVIAAPPRLVLVVDEFATLVKELPEFVDGVVDIAQRGRSLGIHLILATQRPAGVINDAVRANTNLRIALRVADEHDSQDVIGITDAAHISRAIPGRAYVRRGHTEVQEIQTAFSGGPVPGASTDVQVRDRPAPVGAAHDEEGMTQLEKVVELARDAALAERLPPPAAPWLPPLPQVLSFPDVPVDPDLPSTTVAFGLVDRPDLQTQQAATFDLAQDAHLLVVGAGGAGKTTLMRSLATAFAMTWGPDELHIYGLDFGSGGLRPLRALPQCGDVVAGEEPDRVARLFAMLTGEISTRKGLLAAHGTADIAAWDTHAMGAPPPPRVLVLLDGYPGFASSFERVDFGRLIETLPRLISDGRAAGVHFVISTDRRGAVPSAVAALMPSRVVLQLSESDDYLALGLDARSIKGIDLVAGRGFIGGREFQAAVAGSNPAAESTALRQIAARWPAEPATSPPRPVALLPDNVEAASLPLPTKPLAAIVGIGESTHAPVQVDLEHGHFVVAGPYRSGRSTGLETLALSLRASTPAAVFHLVAPRRSPLLSLDIWDRTVAGADAALGYAQELSLEMARTEALVVFVDDADELAEGSAAYALEPLVKRARDGAVRLVIAAEARALQRAFGGWLAEVRKDKQGILLDPDTDVDGDLLGVRLPRSSNTPVPPGRGYVVTRGAIELMQVARNGGSR